MWWVMRDLNPRHSPCKGDALPTELITHSTERGAFYRLRSTCQQRRRSQRQTSAKNITIRLLARMGKGAIPILGKNLLPKNSNSLKICLIQQGIWLVLLLGLKNNPDSIPWILSLGQQRALIEIDNNNLVFRRLDVFSYDAESLIRK